MKTLRVLWLDGQMREYTGVDRLEVKDGVLFLYESPVYGRTKIKTSIPIGNIREWTWLG